MSSKAILQGVVVSDKMQQSVVVAVERQVRDPLYGKIMRRTSKFMAHNDGDAAIQVQQKRGVGRRKLRGAIHSHAGTGTYVTVSILESTR